MVEYAPDAIQQLFDDVKHVIPSAIMSGILGDQAHTYGYHRGRNYLPSSDYSVQLPQDKKGDGEAASALDISWSDPQQQYKCSQRLLNAKHDSRCTNVLREFYGSTDGQNVCGYDYQEQHNATSDDSHLWHIHISVLREFANDYNAIAPVATVITGSGTETDTGTDSGVDEMPLRTQIRRDSDGNLKGNSTHTLSWNVEDVDSGNIFFGANKPGKGEKGSRLNMGKPEGRNYISTVSLTIDDIPEGGNVLVALGFCDAETGEDLGQTNWAEFISNNGATQIVDTRAMFAGKGKGVKVLVKPSANCTVKAGGVWTTLYW